MDFRQLNYLVAIVETGGFSQASRQLNLAQPALSQQMARLEQEIGAPLFHRSSRGVTSTIKGRTLYRHAKFILRQMDQALSLTRKTDEGVSGYVSIGLPPTTAAQIGAALVERMHNKYPAILCNIVEAHSGNLRSLATDNSLDLAILFKAGEVPDWEAEPILSEELFLIQASERPLFPEGASSVSVTELPSIPLILPSRQHGLRRSIEMELERRGISCVPVAEVDSFSVLMECVGRGMGATIKPLSALNYAGAGLASRWSSLAIRDVSFNRIHYLYSMPEAQLPAAARIVREELLGLTHEQVFEGIWKGVSLAGVENLRGQILAPNEPITLRQLPDRFGRPRKDAA